MAVISGAQSLELLVSRSFSVCRDVSRNNEKAAAPAGKHQYRECGIIAVGSGHRAGHRRENPANAEIIRRIQECGRFSGHPRHRQEATGQNAQISHRRQSRSVQIRAASDAASCKGRAPTSHGTRSHFGAASYNPAVTTLELFRANHEPRSFSGLRGAIREFGAWGEAARYAEEPGRRCGCRSLREPRLFSGGWSGREYP